MAILRTFKKVDVGASVPGMLETVMPRTTTYVLLC